MEQTLTDDLQVLTSVLPPQLQTALNDINDVDVICVLDLEGRRWTRRLFAYSLVYVALLFGLFAISPFLP